MELRGFHPSSIKDYSINSSVRYPVLGAQIFAQDFYDS